jgi:hypothetical protein
VPELIEARPPSALVAGVAGRGAEEGNGSTGVPITGSPGLGRQRSGVTSAMKVAGGGGRRALVRVARGSEMGQGGTREERWEEGMPGCPFIRSKGEQGSRASEGNRWRRWCIIMVLEAAVSRGDRPRWWWGVMKGGVLRLLWERKGHREAVHAHT